MSSEAHDSGADGDAHRHPSTGGGRGRVPTIELLLEVRRLSEDLGHTPTASDMNVYGEHWASTYRRRDEFDGWDDVVWAAGLEPRTPTRRIPLEDLCDELHRLADEVGHTPRAYDMTEYGQYSVSTYQSREEFGHSWSGAIEYVGLDPMEGHRKPSSATGGGTRYTLVRRHATTIASLPDPLGDDPWFYMGSEDIDQTLLQKLHSRRLIDKRDSLGVMRWRLKAHIYEAAVESAANSDTLPCGHVGVHNVRGGGFECANCGASCTREQARAVLSQSVRADGSGGLR